MKSFTQTLEEMDQLADFLQEDIENIQRVIDFCDRKDIDAEFEIHAKAETCEESVQHSPIEISQIVKTLVFIAGDDPVAVLAPGDKRVSEEKLERITDKEVDMAEASEVEEATGYVIGGVSPFDLEIPVYMEESLLDHEWVRPAAGSRLVGVNIDPEKLSDLGYVEERDVVER
jgi:prolyl-tRNA editing enzyme YbaK/EbsC (Cys-tRNA(Pro) deacylase)